MAKIRHVAFMVNDAKALRDFYVQGFGFEQVSVKTGSLHGHGRPLQPGVAKDAA